MVALLGTINGTPKGFYFNEHLRWTDRLLPFQSRIVYRPVYSPPEDSFRFPSPERWAARLRDEVNLLLRSLHLVAGGLARACIGRGRLDLTALDSSRLYT